MAAFRVGSQNGSYSFGKGNRKDVAKENEVYLDDDFFSERSLHVMRTKGIEVRVSKSTTSQVLVRVGSVENLTSDTSTLDWKGGVELHLRRTSPEPSFQFPHLTLELLG